MSILFSGDFHANARNELSFIAKESLIAQYGNEVFESLRYQIILGDGGFMWQGAEKTDKQNYMALDKRPFPVLCVMGNHEPLYGKNDLPETDIGIGETVYKINDKPFVAYLKRGKVYNIDGIKCLVLGGALSIDKHLRVPNVSWWENEYWDVGEKESLFKLLKTENNFDCVISHTGPRAVNLKLFFSKYPDGVNTFFENTIDEVGVLNDEIQKQINFKEWWCGHFHKDKYYYDDVLKHGYHYLYETTKILEKVGNNLAIRKEYDRNGYGLNATLP